MPKASRIRAALLIVPLAAGMSLVATGTAQAGKPTKQPTPSVGWVAGTNLQVTANGGCSFTVTGHYFNNGRATISFSQSPDYLTFVEQVSGNNSNATASWTYTLQPGHPEQVSGLIASRSGADSAPLGPVDAGSC